jgi:hypothetical protein
VIALTGASKAVTGTVTAVARGHDLALIVTGAVPAVTAVADGPLRGLRAEGPGLFRLTRGRQTLFSCW